MATLDRDRDGVVSLEEFVGRLAGGGRRLSQETPTGRIKLAGHESPFRSTWQRVKLKLRAARAFGGGGVGGGGVGGGGVSSDGTVGGGADGGGSGGGGKDDGAGAPERRLARLKRSAHSSVSLEWSPDDVLDEDRPDLGIHSDSSTDSSGDASSSRSSGPLQEDVQRELLHVAALEDIADDPALVDDYGWFSVDQRDVFLVAAARLVGNWDMGRTPSPGGWTKAWAVGGGNGGIGGGMFGGGNAGGGARRFARPLLRDSPPTKQLRILTWNVWLDPIMYRQRLQALLHCVEEAWHGSGGPVDVICFQEATWPFLRMLANLDWLQRDYVLSDPEGLTFRGPEYGVILAVRRQLNPRFDTFRLPSGVDQGRKLCTAEVWANGEKLLLGSVHLESRADKQHVRLAQLKVAAAVFGEFERAAAEQLQQQQQQQQQQGSAAAGGASAAVRCSTVLCGDFNAASTAADLAEGAGRGEEEDEDEEEEQQMVTATLPGHVDLWPMLHPDDPGYTHGTSYVGFYSSTKKIEKGRAGGGGGGHPHRQHHAHPRRADRVLAKLSPSWKAAHMELLGTDSAAKHLPRDAAAAATKAGLETPSDHVGLVATLSFEGGS
eukprot:g3651.t1